MADGNNVLDYPQMTRQREENIQAKEIAYAEDVNAEFDYIMDTFNQLVSMLTGEWGDGTGRIYDLVDDAVSLANQALVAAQNCVQKTGDTMTGHLNISLVPASDYNVVNKKYVDDTIDAELAEPINRITTLENWKTNLDATQIKLDNANFSSTNINDGMNELFISVSNGKAIVAAAITGKGIETASDASFKTMADNINAILTFTEGTAGGTATAADIAYGKTAYARGQLLVGTLVGFDTSDATATPYDILQGKTAYVNTGKIEGILTVNEDTGEPSYDIGSVQKIYSSDTNTVSATLNAKLSNNRSTLTYYLDTAGKKYFEYDLTMSTSGDLTITNEMNGQKKTFTAEELGLKVLTSITDEVGTTTNMRILDIDVTSYSNSVTQPYLAVLAYVSGSTYVTGYTIMFLPFTANSSYDEPDFEFNTQNNVYLYNELSTSYDSSKPTGYTKNLNVSEDGKHICMVVNTDGSSAFIDPRPMLYFYDVDETTLIPSLNMSNRISGNDYSSGPVSFSTINNRIAYNDKSIYVLNDVGKYVYNNMVISDIEDLVEYASNNTTYAVMDDGLHYMCIYLKESDKKFYVNYGELSINYNTGTVTKVNKGTKELPMLYAGDNENNNTAFNCNAYCMANSKILIFTYYSNYNQKYMTVTYRIDLSTTNILIPLTQVQLGTSVTFNKYCNTNLLKFGQYLFETLPDYTNVIGLSYNGDNYYKREVGVLSAGAGDVLLGKTFIGYTGEVETGTMEV